MSQQSSILDEIQALSNERQRLYRQKWTVRNGRDYRQRIKKLDQQITDLWHERRVELAGPQRRSSVHHLRQVEPAAQLQAPLKPKHIANADGVIETAQPIDLADQLAQIVQEVLAELREDDEERKTVPLRTLLARRKQTLAWTDMGRGRVVSQVVGLSAAS